MKKVLFLLLVVGVLIGCKKNDHLDMRSVTPTIQVLIPSAIATYHGCTYYLFGPQYSTATWVHAGDCPNPIHQRCNILGP